VVVVVDQFRADYLGRLEGLWSGGMRRLLDEGVVFTQAHHGNAVTETGPGHASLATGAHPARHGIVANEWFDRGLGRTINCVEDREDAAVTSPSNLLLPTLGDRLKRRYPASRVYAASGKDRGAVLMAGHLGDGAFWYDDDEDGYLAGRHYYEAGVPRWFEEWKAAGPGDELYLAGWAPLPVEAAAAATAGFSPFDRGPFDHGSFSSPAPGRLVGGLSHRRDESFYAGLFRTPGIDAWLGRLGAEIVVREGLGEDGSPDLLSLSFSALDIVGHAYGPTSLEVLDTLLRLDRTLGELFDLLDGRLGADGWAVAVSADHGVVPLAESAGADAGLSRAGLAEAVCLRRIGDDLAARRGDGVWIGNGWDALYLDRTVLAAAGVASAAELAAVQEELALAVEECPSVAEAWTLTELLAMPAPAVPPHPGDDGWLPELQRRNAHAGRSPDVTIQWVEGFNPSVTHYASHGSPYAYDTHVPLVVRLPGVAAATVDEPVETVDLAPTLAALLGLEPAAEVDGVDRSALLGAVSADRGPSR